MAHQSTVIPAGVATGSRYGVSEAAPGPRRLAHQIRVKNSDLETASVEVRQACCFHNRSRGGYSQLHACSNDTRDRCNVLASGQRSRWTFLTL